MPKKSSSKIKKVAKLMRDLDFCMLTTRTKRGGLHARPMSNNGEVEFDGDVWFFSATDSRKVREIEAQPSVHLSYVDLDGWRFVSMIGRARIVRDAEKKQELWVRLGAVVRRRAGKRCHRAHQSYTDRRLLLDQEGCRRAEDQVVSEDRRKLLLHRSSTTVPIPVD